MDDESDAQLVFAYRGQKYEQVVVGLTGCADIGGSGMLSDALRADLRPLAPRAWRHYVMG